MKKIFPLLLIVGGGLLILFSVWRIWQADQLQKSAIQEAKEKLTSPVQKQEYSQEGELVNVDFQADQGDVIGILKIPSLDRELPIIAGVEEEDLERGVGHYTGTSYPGQESQVVLSGHRDTVFRQFGELEIGDSFIVEMPYGSFEYTIRNSEIVPEDDLTVINPDDYQEEMLTVTTCYPFHYIGNAPDRYILYATPVKDEE
ncbi:sortase A [Lederbergia galactosidilyticus]|uniref:class D sortase n=1 Tax=Lederbergia galactosidilytica TaxID=217031 RepID=UPI001AE1AA41|nr:class D sortase [Lederbergia galactosidilytica]MBP1914454.1 sortase A [Lederbergia galactosidilytica]